MGGRILAVDPGSRRLGLALSDPDGVVALPLEVIKAEAGVERVGEIAREHLVVEIIVGLPLRLDGSEGPEAAEARKLAADLGRRLSIPVRLVDERLTTVIADRAFDEGRVGQRKRRPVVDKVAAAVLLQSYLDRRKSS